MPRIDRRVQKSQEAIKKAFIELMSDKNLDQLTIQDISDRANVGRRTIYDHYLDKFDILEKLIEEHIEELRKLCKAAADLSFAEGNLIWFDYFERHHSFFYTMTASKGASTFRKHFLAFVMEELEDEVNVTEGKNKGLSKELVLNFFSAAIVEIVEVWIMKGLKEPTEVIAEQVGVLLDRNLD
ncbi:TetR/AcrR family transcriptional regulator [Metabacillus sp. GX 13764]|uniref:TetR/AcrR family transcriptional regulator n=1 Tax=Metabacillus kandeliae TaxID=2900151 RepID=UPI001E3060F5|nr:TetR/AcrR family transcriptional regulator [Metabacillus kandeliae]MCD7035701.1 TetR/AcrR family transcriptional regulator [Metabacillus kandeliae]